MIILNVILCKKYFLKKNLVLESEAVIADYLQLPYKGYVKSIPLHFVCFKCETKIFRRKL